MNARHSEGALGAGRRYVSFELSGQAVGLPLEAVVEVVRAVAITPLPNAPPIVEGILDVRGTVAAVLDLRRRFGLPAVPLHPDEHLVIARARGRLVGVRVDRATRVIEVPPGALVEPEDGVFEADHVHGIARAEGGLILIHDPDRFLSADETATLDTALSHARKAGGAGA